MEPNNTNIPAGYKSSELGVIPEGWQIKRLGEVCSFKSGGTPSKDIKEFWEGSIPWISASTMHSMKIYDSELHISEAGLKSGSNLATKDTLLLLVRGSMLWNKIPICLCMRDVAFNQDVKCVDAEVKYTTNIFLLYWILANENNLLHSVVGTGIGAGKLESNELKKTKLAIPPLEEQERIAEILGTWDKAIELEGRKVALLQSRKRALMQQLLTPHRRLPNFSEPWETTKLGEIGNTYNGLTGKTKEDFGFGLPYISYMTVFNSSKIKGKIMDYVNIGKNETQNMVKYGDAFFTVSSETPDEVGMSSVLLDNINNTYLNSFCFGYRLFNFETLLPEFAQFYFRSKKFRIEMYILAQGSTRFNISKNEVLKLKIKLPPIDEQRAIAEVLTTADREIELATQNLTALRSQKRALMQQLLTGKKRLSV